MADPVPVPAGTSELGIDIIKVGRIRDTLARFGARFSERVLTPGAPLRPRQARNIGRPLGGEEAVSKVLGLGVRGIGWKEIEVERLPTGQPAVRLHGRALRRAEQLGMERIALSISHESDYAVAIAFGIGPRAGGSCSRSTSRNGSTTASVGSSPGSSGCASSPRKAARPRWPRTLPSRRVEPRSWNVADKRPIGFAQRSDGATAVRRRPRPCPRAASS